MTRLEQIQARLRAATQPFSAKVGCTGTVYATGPEAGAVSELWLNAENDLAWLIERLSGAITALTELSHDPHEYVRNFASAELAKLRKRPGKKAGRRE